MKNKLLPNVQGVGYIGNGPYDSLTLHKGKRPYKVWSAILERCYSEKSLVRRPAYKDCTVAPEWHNFQVFAAWFEANYIEGCTIDKDIKVLGNKVYGPDFCIFVSLAENVAAAKSKEYVLLDPSKKVVKFQNLQQFCKRMGLNRSCMRRVLTGLAKHHHQWRLPE